MVAASCRLTWSSGWTSAGRRSSPAWSRETARSGERSRCRRPTAGQAQLLDELDGLVEDLLADGAAAIGVGVPMNLDRRTGVGLGAVNLPLRALDLAGHLRDRFARSGRGRERRQRDRARRVAGRRGPGRERPRRARARDGRRRGRRARRAPLPRLGGARPRRRRGGRAAVPGQLPRSRPPGGRRVRRGGGARGRGAVGRGRRRPPARARGARRPRGRAFGARPDRALPRGRDRLVRERLRARARRRRRRVRDGGVGVPRRAGRGRGADARRSHPADESSGSCRPRSATTPGSSARGSSASRRSTGCSVDAAPRLRDADRQPRRT